MRKLKLFLLQLSLLLGCCSHSFAQGFPWADFKPRTLKEIVALDAREIKQSEKRNSIILHADMLLSVVRVKYTGKSRPVSKTKKELLANWAQTFTGNGEQYAAMYEEDLLFTEDGVEYWLPVQKKVIPHFTKELKEGDEVDLYLVRAGGVCVKKVCDWFFLVEEFQKPEPGKVN
ncbi:MAG TPA: hypothetical protein VGO96_19915 [Pyrinomonadaceae bacterium]|jgi:hypothetical protein|nr:hypothetical protein [Pyrinomonadaceae bacterium]